jgi:hypothetical protein
MRGSLSVPERQLDIVVLLMRIKVVMLILCTPYSMFDFWMTVSKLPDPLTAHQMAML